MYYLLQSAEAESAEALNARLIGIGAQKLAELRRNGRFILEHHLGNAKGRNKFKLNNICNFSNSTHFSSAAPFNPLLNPTSPGPDSAAGVGRPVASAFCYSKQKLTNCC
jgi:hypothetical protein